MNENVLNSAIQSVSWRDYLTLCKPKVVLLMLLTSLVGMLLSVPGIPSLWLCLIALLGIGLCAGCAATLNHVVDSGIDKMMARTKSRPVATGKISVKQAISFALGIGLSGFIILWFYVNVLTAVLTFFTLMGYAVVYTLYLKRATAQNIVIGGLSGAIPPLLGWTAITNNVSAESLLLVLIIFTWTPPHFWALALYRLEDYKKAEIPMLPVTHGVKLTKLYILLYTILLFIITLLPYVIRTSGLIYLIITFFLNLRFLYWAIKLYKTDKDIISMKMFKYSISYLMLLFLALLIDHYCLILIN